MFGKNNQKLIKVFGIVVAVLMIVALLVSYLPYLV